MATPTERNKATRARKTAAGLKMVNNLYVHPDEKKEACELARALPKTKAILDKIKGKDSE